MDSPPKSVAVDYIDHESASYAFLSDPVVDALVQIVLELGAEGWVTRRRLLALEAVLSAQGVVVPPAVDAFTPTPEMETAWREERDRMMRALYGALARRPMSAEAVVAKMKAGAAPRRPPRNAGPVAERPKARGPSGV